MNEQTDNSERMILAIGQIERALSRMETAVAHRHDTLPPTNDADTAQHQLQELQKLHQNLRTAAENAIRQIDQLTEKG